jgi:hypothetical protein
MIKKLKRMSPPQNRITDLFMIIFLLSMVVFCFLKIAGATTLLMHNY